MHLYLLAAMLLLLIPRQPAHSVFLDSQNVHHARVARNIKQVESGQGRDSVLKLLGSPVNKSEFESKYWYPATSLGGMQAVAADWWFDGHDVYIVRYKQQNGRLVACTWEKAIVLK
jgi:hypothetical protein